MDLQTITDHVRTYFDIDASDLPSSLITNWANQGEMRVYRAHNRWPHYETIVTLDTVADQSDYATSELTALTAIYSVDVDPPVGPISPIDQATARERYFIGTTARQGRPEAWSRWGGQFTVWPVPDAVYGLTVTGYRGASVMAAAGDEPDMPDDFHQVVLEWVMHKACLHQEDPQMAGIYQQSFDSLLGELKADALKDDMAGPMIFGGGRWQNRLGVSRLGLSSGLPGELRGPGLGGWGA